MANYSILVDTCDAYSDCWDPFFNLFSKYWPDCDADIYLNTEYKDYSYQGLNIKCTKICQVHGCNPKVRQTWSQCLLWALEMIDTDIVLFMQEDFFLYAPVDNSAVLKYVQMMNDNDKIHCLHLTPYLDGDKDGTGIPNIDFVDRKYAYRVDCQSALWRNSVMREYVDIRESAWEFEKLGSMRARFMHHNFYKIKKQFLESHLILPYYCTGIIKSRWSKRVCQIFSENGITVDYSIRGFYEDMPKENRVDYVMTRIPKIPSYLRQIPVLTRLALSYIFKHEHND